MRISDWGKAQKLMDEFGSFLNPRKLREFAIENPKSLNDIWSNNDHFPCADFVGVYFIFDKNKKLLYIGKASASSSIGKRLDTYFKSDKEVLNGWKLTSPNWSIDPHFIAAIGVEKMLQGSSDQGWLAPDLEEFLIGRFENLPDNTQLKN